MLIIETLVVRVGACFKARTVLGNSNNMIVVSNASRLTRIFPHLIFVGIVLYRIRVGPISRSRYRVQYLKKIQIFREDQRVLLEKSEDEFMKVINFLHHFICYPHAEAWVWSKSIHSISLLFTVPSQLFAFLSVERDLTLNDSFERI